MPPRVLPHAPACARPWHVRVSPDARPKRRSVQHAQPGSTTATCHMHRHMPHEYVNGRPPHTLCGSPTRLKPSIQGQPRSDPRRVNQRTVCPGVPWRPARTDAAHRRGKYGWLGGGASAGAGSRPQLSTRRRRVGRAPERLGARKLRLGCNADLVLGRGKGGAPTHRARLGRQRSAGPSAG